MYGSCKSATMPPSPIWTTRLAGCFPRCILIRELADREEGYSDGKSLIVGKPPVTVLGNHSENSI